MPFALKTLDRAIISLYLDNLVELDRTVIRDMGLIYGNDPWDKLHFCKELNRKWEFSQIAVLQPEERLCGFMIASEMLHREVHIHRFAVGSDFRGVGIGNLLINRISDIAFQHAYKRVTVEVSRLNTGAISFYEKHGFARLSESELSSYAAKRKQGIAIVGNFTRELDGSEFYILQKAVNSDSEETRHESI